MRLMQEQGSVAEPREVLNRRDVFMPRPQSASAASDRRMGLDPSVMQGLDPVLESRIQAQISAAAAAGLLAPDRPHSPLVRLFPRCFHPPPTAAERSNCTLHTPHNPSIQDQYSRTLTVCQSKP